MSEADQINRKLDEIQKEFDSEGEIGQDEWAIPTLISCLRIALKTIQNYSNEDSHNTLRAIAEKLQN